jgi:putative ABC transport system permease protein
MMDNLWQDLRYGIRMLLRSPGFTLVGVLALALGIGANTAIFSVVNAVLLRPLPYPDPDRLVLLSENFSRLGLNRISVSAPEFIDYRDRSQSFERVAAYKYLNFNLTGVDEPERILGASVSAGLFTLLGINPSRGRAFLPEEDQPGGHPVVVLSHGLWQRRFGADPSVVGKTLRLNGNHMTVVGIMPPGFQFPAQAELWAPIVFNDDALRQRQSRSLRVIARLKPDVTLKQAQAEMSTFARQLTQQYPDIYLESNGWSITLTPLREQMVGNLRTTLLVLLGAVGFVLLIACANVANLLLARAAARQKEIAIRTALGAGRRRLVRQLLTESVLLALVGGTLGLLLALWGIDLLAALRPPGIPALVKISVDAPVLAFTILTSLLTGILFGLAPALAASKLDLNESLKEGGRGAAGSRGRHRLGSILVISEVALALVLLIGAGLLIKGFLRLRSVDPGFNPKNVLVTWTVLSPSKYPDRTQVADFYQTLLARIEALPGVQFVGATNDLPLSGDNSSWGFTTEAHPRPAPGEVLEANYRVASPNYFRAMGISLVRGRFFTEFDNESAPGAVIINETMARRFWSDEDPIGKRMKLGSPDPQHTWDGLWLTIVGVVGDVKHFGLAADARPEMYVTYLQNPWRGLPAAPYMTVVWRGVSLVVRVAAEPTALAAAVRRAVWSVDKDQPVFGVNTIEQVLSNSVAQRRFTMLLLSLFAALALVLAALGIYGVMSYAVTQRTREIGIRMSLGAQPSDALRLVLKQGLGLALVGVGIGLAAAFTLTRVLSGLLYSVSATDPATFAGISLLLAAVALLACYIPARRATRVDPMVALRYE